MNKFKKQLYISQRFLERSQTWTFQVQIRKDNILVCKNFREKEYGSARNAYERAIAFRDITLNQIVNGEYIERNNKTIDDCYKLSFELYPVLYGTRKNFDLLYKNIDDLKNKNIQSLTVEDIQLSINKLIYKYNDEYISRFYSLWSRIIKTALIKKYINQNIMNNVIKPKSQKVKNNKEQNIINKNDLDKVIELIKESNINKYDKYMYINLLLILYYTGARPCEILALNKSDIKNNNIYINKELGSSLNEYGVIRKTKTKLSNRIIPISKEFNTVIKNVFNLNNYEILICKEDGSYYKQRKISQLINRLCKNKVNFNMYALRHLFSTDLLDKNVDPKTHQELLGHSNYNMSLYYANSTEKKKKNAIKDR